MSAEIFAVLGDCAIWLNLSFSLPGGLESMSPDGPCSGPQGLKFWYWGVQADGGVFCHLRSPLDY